MAIESLLCISCRTVELYCWDDYNSVCNYPTLSDEQVKFCCVILTFVAQKTEFPSFW